MSIITCNNFGRCCYEITQRYFDKHRMECVLIKLADSYLSGAADIKCSKIDLYVLALFLIRLGENSRLLYFVPTISNNYNLEYTESFLEALSKAEQYLIREPAILNRINIIKKLIAGFESPFGISILYAVYTRNIPKPGMYTFKQIKAARKALKNSGLETIGKKIIAH